MGRANAYRFGPAAHMCVLVTLLKECRVVACQLVCLVQRMPRIACNYMKPASLVEVLFSGLEKIRCYFFSGCVSQPEVDCEGAKEV